LAVSISHFASFTAGAIIGDYSVDGSAGNVSTLQINALGATGGEITTIGNGAAASAIELNGANAKTLFTDANGNNALALGAVTSNATLMLAGGYDMTTPGALTNAGSVDIGGSNTTLDVTGEYTQTGGHLVVASGGTLNVTGFTPFHLMGGTAQVDGTVDPATSASLIDVGAELFGTGDFVGNLTSSGEMFPGDDPAPGEFTIDGTYEQTATGTLMEDITGTEGSPATGLLNVEGNVRLDSGAAVDIGALTFTPTFGQEFEILAYTGTLSGTFNLGGIDASDFNLVYNSNSVDLQWNQNTSATPEPSSFWIALGALGLAGARKRSKKRNASAGPKAAS
jgi:hypothetical protein